MALYIYMYLQQIFCLLSSVCLLNRYTNAVQRTPTTSSVLVSRKLIHSFDDMPSCHSDSRPYCRGTCIFWSGSVGLRTPILGEHMSVGGRRLLYRALVSSYSLSVVSMSLSAAVWPQFATQVFAGGVSTRVLGEGEGRHGTGGIR